MRYSLRTLLILLAVLPPIIALCWFGWPSFLVTVCLLALAAFSHAIGLAITLWLESIANRIRRK